MGGQVRRASALAVLLVAATAPVIPAGAQTGDEAPIPATVSARLDGLPVPMRAAAAAGTEQVSEPAEAPLPFSMVGLDLPAEATARFRTSPDGTTWDPWEPVETLEFDDGPDLGTPEEAAAAAFGTRQVSDAIWVGEARFLQVAVEGGSPADVGAVFIDSNGLSADAAAAGPIDPSPEATAPEEMMSAAAASRPPIISRQGWGANESLRKGRTAHAPAARYAVVHHTAGSNRYTRAEAPAVVRGIYHYHTRSLGWDDIGYNFLVDRYGRIFEGRAGGIDKAVIGSHARGFNTGSIGVAMLGEFTSAAPPTEALGAVAAVIAWKFRVHGIGTGGTVRVVSGGSDRYRQGVAVNLPPIVAHRDVGRTECPGNAYYRQMSLLRQSVQLRGAPTTGRPGQFNDIGGSVHAGSIQRLAASGVTGGCGNGRFCPDHRITRGQAVTILNRSLGRRPGGGAPFRDVPASHPHSGSIAAAVGAGWISGYPNGTFRPDDTLTREQTASVLARAAGLARVPGQRFRDVPWSSPHLANVNAIGRSGIASGCGGGRFCPRDRVTRGQMATWTVRMLDRR
jgi:hypothetical protein